MKVGLSRLKIRPGSSPIEPSNLLGMHHRFRNAGVSSKIYPGDAIGRTSLVLRMKMDKVTHAGISIVSAFDENVDGYRDLCQALRENGIVTIVGGVAGTLDPEYVARMISPDVVVQGPGEPVIDRYIASGCSWTKLEGTEIDRGRIGETRVFGYKKGESPLVPMDSIDYWRDFDFGPYDFSAWPFWQIGCPSRCIFCPSDQRVRYKSPGATLEEMGHLVNEKKVTRISPLGDDYFSDPRYAAAQIDALIERGYDRIIYKFQSGVFSLNRTLVEHGEVMTDFILGAKGVAFKMGIESLSPSERNALGKDPSLGISARAPGVLDESLRWLETRGCDNAVIRANLIMLNPHSTFEGFLDNLDELESRIRKYPDHFLVEFSYLRNTLDPTPGTIAWELFNVVPDSRPDNIQTVFTAYTKHAGPRIAMLWFYLKKSRFDPAVEKKFKELGTANNFSMWFIPRLRRIAKKLKLIEAFFLAPTYHIVIEQLNENDFSYFNAA